MIDEQSYGRDQIVNIINSVLGKIQTSQESMHDALRHELADLKASIEDLGKELHSSEVGDIKTTHIPTATDELYAVVEATEEATNNIMEACETVLQISQKCNEAEYKKVEEQMMRVFEACSFQDITGQRIKKVTTCLQEIDEKTEKILSLLDSSAIMAQKEANGTDEEASLLNGPALPASAMSQDDIDKLLSDFDDGGN